MKENKGWRKIFQDKPQIAAGVLFLILFAIIAVPWILIFAFPNAIDSFVTAFSQLPLFIQFILATPCVVWFILQLPALIIPAGFFPDPFEYPSTGAWVLNIIINSAISAVSWTLLVYFLHSLLSRKRLTRKEK